MSEDFKTILLSLGFSNIRETASELRMKPIYRESDNDSSLCVYKRNGYWIDFVTNQKGFFNDLIKLVGGQQIKIQTESRPYLDKYIIKHFEPFEIIDDHSYWKNRGISIETLREFGGGVCKSGKMANRYIFPVLFKNKIIGVSGRSIIDKKPKWKHVGNISSWIYPYFTQNDIKQSQSAILVESIGDCLSLYDCGIKNVIVTFGLNVSNAIILSLIKNDINNITISFNNDSDSNRGNEAAIKAQNKLKLHFDNVVIKLPPKKDFNEMITSDGKESILLWMKNDSTQ